MKKSYADRRSAMNRIASRPALKIACASGSFCELFSCTPPRATPISKKKASPYSSRTPSSLSQSSRRWNSGRLRGGTPLCTMPAVGRFRERTGRHAHRCVAAGLSLHCALRDEPVIGRSFGGDVDRGVQADVDELADTRSRPMHTQ